MLNMCKVGINADATLGCGRWERRESSNLHNLRYAAGILEVELKIYNNFVDMICLKLSHNLGVIPRKTIAPILPFLNTNPCVKVGLYADSCEQMPN